jgi:glycosyltransferase involved in cell wall biosynthesis
MRIGIVPVIRSSSGGIYQYSLSMLHVLNGWKANGSIDEFVIFARNIQPPSGVLLNANGWLVKPLYPPSLKQMIMNVTGSIVGEEFTSNFLTKARNILRQAAKQLDPDRAQYRTDINGWFLRNGVQLMLYPFPISWSFEAGIPYVMAIHDLQHRLQPEFPEVSAQGEWERREYLFRNGARHATLLLADSEVGKEDILNFYGPYGVTPDRVKILPFLPAWYLAVHISEGEQQRVRMTYNLPDRYLFYPAQFWPHKNHARIFQALGVLKQQHHLKISVVFCGPYTGKIRRRVFHEVMSISHQLGLEKQIYYLGIVPDKHMSALYAGAVALVMPTFFGPTNIPVLEAWALGCPVITSDIRGIRDQAGDAAILVDPCSVEAIADAIYQLWLGENLRHTLIERGRRRLTTYTPDDYRQRLIEILEEAKARVCAEKPRNAEG